MRDDLKKETENFITSTVRRTWTAFNLLNAPMLFNIPLLSLRAFYTSACEKNSENLLIDLRADVTTGNEAKCWNASRVGLPSDAEPMKGKLLILSSHCCGD